MTTVIDLWGDLVDQLREDVPASTVLGMIERLSGGNAEYIGPQDGRGLMQLHPDTAAMFGLGADELLEPITNVATGIELLTLRRDELVDVDPSLAERPGDLGLLTLGAYWFGPRAIVETLSALGPGATALDVLSQPGMEQIATFVGDLDQRIRRIAAELGEPEPAQPQPPTGEGVEPFEMEVVAQRPKTDTGISRGWLTLLGLGAVGGAVWLFSRE